MATFDTIPALRPDEEFPIGNYVNPYKQARAGAWLSMLEVLDHQDFATQIEKDNRPITNSPSSRRLKMHTASLTLCRAWDGTTGIKGFQYARDGYRTAAAFDNAANYLPAYAVDLSPEIKQMSRPDEQLHRAREFGRAAWQSMQMYDGIYRVFNRLLEHSKSRYDLSLDAHYEFFRAGMALPYSLAVAGNLYGYTPAYTSFQSHDKNGQKMDLATTNFERFFTT